MQSSDVKIGLTLPACTWTHYKLIVITLPISVRARKCLYRNFILRCIIMTLKGVIQIPPKCVGAKAMERGKFGWNPSLVSSIGMYMR